jgi:hypothetical protein
MSQAMVPQPLNVGGGQKKQRVAGVGWAMQWMNEVWNGRNCCAAANASCPPPGWQAALTQAML